MRIPRRATPSQAAQRRPHRLTLGEVRIARVETWIGRVIIGGAVIAAAVSFWQVQWAASLIGIPRLATWGFPLIVDGIGTVMAALTMSVHSRPFRQRLYVWTFFLAFIAISLFCNALHAVTYVAAHPLELPKDLREMRWGIVFLLAAIPPVGAAIGMHAYAFTRRHGVGAEMRAPAPEVRAPAPERARNARTVRTPVRTDSEPSPPVRAPAPVHAPARTAVQVDGKWTRLLADPEGARAWDVYRKLRTDTGERPRVKDVRMQAEVQRDPSTVSRWMALFDARWPEGARPLAHTGNGTAPASSD